MRHLPTMNRIPCCAAAIVAGVLALPCLAATPKAVAKPKPAAAKPAAVPVDDLTAAPIHHVAVCPPPKAGPCVIKKPIATGYRVLTTGVDLEDKNGDWIADFSKGPKGPKVLLQVLGLNGDLHDIEVSFQAKPAATKARPKKK
jgi:hypothetical protein